MLHFLELMEKALPDDLSMSELAIPFENYFANNNFQELASALQHCSYIDWNAYITNYPEACSQNVTPAYYFITSGIYKGHRLWSKHPLSRSDFFNVDVPKISIIIPNYNNGLYLEKCLTSLINQTLLDIEIIVVDDASTDNSREIINSFISRDARIRLISFDINQSQHMARKAGVLAASGRYIMFLDPDDFYLPNTCYIAYSTILKGYDIVMFNTRTITHIGLTTSELNGIDYYLNSYSCGIHYSNELFYDLLCTKTLSHTLWNKIYNSSICKKAYMLTVNGYYTVAEDLYVFLFIITITRNIYKINDVLYVYNRGNGWSSEIYNKTRAKQQINSINMLYSTINFFNDIHLTTYNSYIKEKFFFSSIYHIEKYNFAEQYLILSSLSSYFELTFIIEMLIKKFSNSINYLYKLIYSTIKIHNSVKLFSKNICFLINKQLDNSIFELIINLLSKSNLYGITVYILIYDENVFNTYSLLYNNAFHILRIDNQDYIVDTYKFLKENNIDTILLFIDTEYELTSELLLFLFLDISIIGILTNLFLHKINTQYLQLFDKIICFNEIEEAYLRINEVDAFNILENYIDDDNNNEALFLLCKNDELLPDKFSNLINTSRYFSTMHNYQLTIFQNIIKKIL